MIEIMNQKYTYKLYYLAFIAVAGIALSVWSTRGSFLEASSHREAPLITEDPLADITDLYAFRSPCMDKRIKGPHRGVMGGRAVRPRPRAQIQL